MKFLGVDPSTKTGLYLLNTEGASSSKVLSFPDRKGLHRVQSLSDAFDEFLDRHSPDLVCIEGYVRQSFAVITNVEIGVNLRMSVHKRGIVGYIVPPTVLKKYATGSGAANKPQIAKAVLERWGWTSPSDDVVDAYVLARIAEVLSTTGVSQTLVGVERGF